MGRFVGWWIAGTVVMLYLLNERLTECVCKACLLSCFARLYRYLHERGSLFLGLEIQCGGRDLGEKCLNRQRSPKCICAHGSPEERKA